MKEVFRRLFIVLWLIATILLVLKADDLEDFVVVFGIIAALQFVFLGTANPRRLMKD